MAELVWTVTVLCIGLASMACIADRVPESWVEAGAALLFGAPSSSASVHDEVAR